MSQKQKDAERMRAMAKAFSMSVLFQEPIYEQIVNVLERKRTNPSLSLTNIKADLELVIRSAPGMSRADAEWVSNYLQHYDYNLAYASDLKFEHPDARNFHW